MSQLPDLQNNECDLVKKIREQLLNWEQEEVANYFYLHVSRIRHWENDEKSPLGYVLSLISIFAEQEGIDSKTRLQFLEYANKIINEYYKGTNLLHSWDKLHQVANAYYEKRCNAHERKFIPPDPLMFALNNSSTWSLTVDLLLVLIPKMEKAGYREELIPYLKDGIQRSNNNNDYKKTAKLCLYLGNLYQLQGKYDEAKNHIEDGYKYFKDLDDSCNQAGALNLLAFIAYRQCKFQDGLDLIKLSLELSKENSQEKIFSDYVLGIITLRQRNWEEADILLQKVFNSWKQYNNQWMMGRTLTFRGSALRQMKEYQEATNIYEQAILLLDKAGDPARKAMAQMNLGNIFYQQAQFKKALKIHLSAKLEFQKTKDMLHIAHVQHNIAMARRELKQFGQAERDCRNSKKLWVQLGDREQLVNTMLELGYIYRDRKSYKEAKLEFEEAINLLEEIKDKPVYKQKLEQLRLVLNETRNLISPI